MKYKDWKAMFYDYIVDRPDLRVCLLCMCSVKYSFLHWFKYHRKEEE